MNTDEIGTDAKECSEMAGGRAQREEEKRIYISRLVLAADRTNPQASCHTVGPAANGRGGKIERETTPPGSVVVDAR
jgi:hypothetical protein